MAERDCELYPDRDSIGEDQEIWVGCRYQAKPVPPGLYCGYEILDLSEGELYVQFRLTDGRNATYNLPEGLFHYKHKLDFKDEYLGDKPCHDPSLMTWNKLSRNEVLENRREYSTDDLTYQELDDFLSNTQILKGVAKPFFRDILNGLQQKWHQLLERFVG